MTTQIERVYLGHEAFRLVRTVLQGREIYYVAGTNSMFVPTQKTKYVMMTRPDGYKICRQWTDENGEVYDHTPGEAARVELKKAFPGLRRVGWQSEHVRLFDWRWPMLFTGPYRGPGSYIDLKGAYWQIYRRLWLDTCFPCGYGSLNLEPVAKALADWKGARNSVIGICAARQAIGVKGFRTVVLNTKNPYLSPGLWATIQAVLNELAYLAEKLGSIYIATDGYIFPEKQQACLFEECLFDLGFVWRRIDDEVSIQNWGVYKVGDKETKAHSQNNGAVGKPFRAIRIFDTRQPERLLAWWAKSVPFYYRRRPLGGIISI